MAKESQLGGMMDKNGGGISVDGAAELGSAKTSRIDIDSEESAAKSRVYYRHALRLCKKNFRSKDHVDSEVNMFNMIFVRNKELLEDMDDSNSQIGDDIFLTIEQGTTNEQKIKYALMTNREQKLFVLLAAD